MSAFTLRPDQQTSVDVLSGILQATGSTIDASDCGAGKTYAAAGLCKQLGRTAFVVAPKATLPSWKAVLEEAGVPIEQCLSWEKARRIKKLDHKQGRLFLFDEVHKAKNRKTANAKLLLKAASVGPVHMMSATAILDPLDMGAIGPVLGLFPPRDYWNWCRRNGCRDGFFGGLEFSGDEKILADIHAKLFPAKGVRVRREDIPGFPDCDIDVMQLDLGKEVGAAYKEFAKQAGVRMEELFGDSADADNPLTQDLKLRQAVEIAKAPALIEVVQEYLDNGTAPVLFLNFRETVETVAAKFPGCAVIMGGNDNETAMKRFQTGDTHVCIVSIAAGGTGISLHDINGVRPRVGLLCPTNDPRAAEQAEGRLWRAGSKSKASLFKLFAAGTVEEKMAKREKKKRDQIKIVNDGMSTQQKPQKRKRSEFQASQAENIEKSPCFRSKEFSSTPWTESGVRVHKCVETNNLNFAETEEEKKLALDCINYASKFKGDVLNEYSLQFLPGSRGIADKFVFAGDHGDLIDWKTGAHKQTPAEDNFQQQIYVLTLFKEFTKLKTICVHLVYPRLGIVSQFSYSRDDMPRLQRRLDNMVAAARAAKESGERTPSSACRNCEHEGRCPAMAAVAADVAKKYDTAMTVPDFAAHPSLISDPKMMGHLLDVKKVLESWCKSVDHHAKKMAFEEHLTPEGYEVKFRAGRREIKDACAAYAAVMDVLGPEDFLRACSVSASKLETEFAAKAPRGSKAQSKKDLAAKLWDIGILNMPEETPYLAKSK